MLMLSQHIRAATLFIISNEHKSPFVLNIPIDTVAKQCVYKDKVNNTRQSLSQWNADVSKTFTNNCSIALSPNIYIMI